MTKSVAVIIAITFHMNVFAEDSQKDTLFYKFIDIGVEHFDIPSKTKADYIQSYWSPKVGLGIGNKLQFSNEWYLENELSIDYSMVNTSKVRKNEKSSGNIEFTGLWATTRLKSDSIVKYVSPFIELEAGLVKANYQFENTHNKENTAVLKASVGLSFSLKNESDMSISVGIREDISNF